MAREYWQYARECARWAAQTKDREDQDLFLDMAKAWTNIALVDGDVTKLAREKFELVEPPSPGGSIFTRPRRAECG